MSVKRELIGSSSSQVTPPVATSSVTASASVSASASSINPAKVKEPSEANALEPESPRILALASPVSGESVGRNDQQKIGGFLEQCYYCKKTIAKDTEVYMYSDFCAFCSVECRDLQIEQDQLAEKDATKHKQKEMGGGDFRPT